MTGPNPTAASSRLADLGPGIIAAVAFALADVFSKMTFTAGMRSCSRCPRSAACSAWFSCSAGSGCSRRRCRTRRAQRWIALGVGVLFAGIVFGLFQGDRGWSTVPVAILTYFVYPLLTGIVGALIGIDKLGWRGAARGARRVRRACADRRRASAARSRSPASPSRFGAALLRTAVLLITRAALHGADAAAASPGTRCCRSTAIFVVVLARHLELASAADRGRAGSR